MNNKTMYEKEKEITDKIDVKEAIKMFQNLIFVENHKIAENHCRKLAIEALEKQIPKEPDLIGDGYDDNGNLIYDTWICPCCQTEYELYYDDYKFCPECGQAIVRSENND